MQNLFLEAMSDSERMEIANIKANKAFARQLVMDLADVFTLNPKEMDSNGYSVWYLLNRKYDDPSFLVKNNSVTFRIKLLGYKNSTQFPLIGELYNKYKETSTADKGFLDDSHGHGNVDFNINIPLENYTDALRDIIRILNDQRCPKKY